MSKPIPDISGMESNEARQRALAEAFEAMREALEFWLAVHSGQPRGLMPTAKEKARTALALADKVSK